MHNNILCDWSKKFHFGKESESSHVLTQRKYRYGQPPFRGARRPTACFLALPRGDVQPGRR
jgi:hypothetical protein